MKGIALIAALVMALAAIAFVAMTAPWRSVGPAPFIASEDEREQLPPQSSVEVRYIANGGVLISSRDKRVLIDGLHRRYKDSYAYLPDAEREKIEAAKAPFDSIDLILVSHMHGDHFHPESVGRYLKSNPKTVLATSQQVADEVAAKFSEYSSIKDRTTPIPFKLMDRTTRTVAGIEVEFLSVGHGTYRDHGTIQNFGHVFSLGGKRFLHLGDVPTTPAIFENYKLSDLNVDVAFMPAWFLTSEEGRAIIRDHIKPRNIIAVHVGPEEGDWIKQQISKEFPDAVVFSTLLERKYF